jgi:hypothetical protein
VRKYLLAAVMIGALARPALALNETPHYLGLAPKTHVCAVLVQKTPGWTILGTYKTTEAATKALKADKRCYSQPV